MIELKYRRRTKMPIQYGVGAPPMSAQLPAGAVVQSMADKEAVVLHPITDKSFKTEADLEAFIAAHNTKVSDVVEISRKVLASP